MPALKGFQFFPHRRDEVTRTEQRLFPLCLNPVTNTIMLLKIHEKAPGFWLDSHERSPKSVEILPLYTAFYAKAKLS